MSVEFLNVGKRARRGGNSTLLFDNLNFVIEPGARTAILGQPKSGKSTLLRMICGTEYAETGTINRASSVSWPIPLADFLVNYLTVAANIRFMMRLYGLEGDAVIREIAALVEISEFLNNRLSESPRYVKQRLPFALGVGLGFDICLFDERVTAVDKEFRPKAADIVKSLGPRKAIVFATSLPKEVADFCNTAFVLENNGLLPFQDVQEGIEYYKSLVQKNAESESDADDAGGEPIEEEFVLEVGI